MCSLCVRSIHFRARGTASHLQARQGLSQVPAMILYTRWLLLIFNSTPRIIKENQISKGERNFLPIRLPRFFEKSEVWGYTKYELKFVHILFTVNQSLNTNLHTSYQIIISYVNFFFNLDNFWKYMKNWGIELLKLPSNLCL